MNEDQAPGPGPRAGNLSINTVAELCKQIDYVIGHPEIGGFDCTLSQEVLADPESKKRAMDYGLRGVSVKIIGSEGTATHIAARVLVTPPQKVRAP